jgi:hypothetical protein
MYMVYMVYNCVYYCDTCYLPRHESLNQAYAHINHKLACFKNRIQVCLLEDPLEHLHRHTYEVSDR